MIGFSVLLAVFMVYVVINEAGYLKEVSEKTRFLKDFDEFLSHVRHSYYYSGSCRDAVFFSIPKSNRRIRPQLELIQYCLEKDDSSVQAELPADINKYVKLFISMAMLVAENGDTPPGEESVFIESVMQLRSDIQDERRFLENRKHRFMGFGLTAALPVLAVPFVASWASGTIPSLLLFYYGRTGNVILCVLLTCSVLCYRCVCELRNGTPSRKRQDKLHILMGKEEFRIICSLCAVAVMIPVLIFGHTKAAKLLLTDVSDIDNICEVADGRQLDAMARVIPKYTSDYVNSGEELQTDAIVAALMNEPGIRTMEVASDTTEEIIRRVIAYKGEHFDLIDVIITLMAGCFMYFYRDIAELFEKAMRESRRQDEIMQFQSLIHMQKRVPGISPVQILESMEEFSDIFRPALLQCINEYSVNDVEALERMAESENYPDFVKIADCFLAIDEAGVEEAFDEISAEIVNFKENRRLTRAILLDNDALLGALLAVIPGGLILFGYLLVPFMVRSLAMFNAYQASLADYIAV